MYIRMLSSFCVGDVKLIKDFLEQFYGSFMKDASAREVVSELQRRKVIPEPVETKIERAEDRKTANGLLYMTTSMLKVPSKPWK